VGWWDASVGVRKSAGTKGGGKYNADRRSIISKVKAEADTGIKQQQVSRWRNGLKRPDYPERIEIPSYKKGFGIEGRRADLQTGEMEWFTPAFYIEKARNVLGTIDLDPASCAEAQNTVKAAQFYSVADDGLNQAWQGTVWLNPPYAGGLVSAFAAKMIASWDSGTLPAAIMLTNAYTETSWFHALTNASRAVCFTRGRIKFESPHGEKCAPTNGQSFFYFGAELDLFCQHFVDVGLVMVKAMPP
jgi:phage N-6-adenine-methyltransferase